ncbi:MAG: repeat-containing protein YrrB [Verrucomicrobiota bacterium]|jgi:predicted O-linked N-acetylglucosamine transferase (SPINDLY family)
MAEVTIAEAFEIALAHHQGSRSREAGELYERILAVQPDHPDASHLLGLLALQAGDCARAQRLIQRAIELNPGAAIYHNSLGQVFDRSSQPAEARAEYEQALRLAPAYVEALNNLGNNLARAGRSREAIATLEAAVTADPGVGQTYSNLGNVLKDSGQLSRAIACFRRAVELCPNDPLLHSNLLLTLHYDPACGPEALLREHRLWDERHGDAGPIMPHENVPDPQRRLRVGYVSPDFNAHPIARFLTPLLRLHRRDEIEVFSYADVPRPDATTAELQGLSDHWRNIAFLSDDDVARQIRADRIDILVDLAAHSARNRLRLFARKPAPVQLTYLAYCSTTGLRHLDYRLSDPFLNPIDQEVSSYSEETLRLESYWCYAPHPIQPLTVTERAGDRGSLTFACLNNPCKISDVTLSAWTQLLQQLPESKLVIHAHEIGRTHLQDHFRAAGLALERVEFVGRQPLADYLATYQRVDIGLDTYPFGGGTTTCDALWMGVPVVSQRGATAVSRAGASLLGQLGLSELVADTPEAYVRIAVALARDPARLRAWRSGLRQQMQSSRLMDGPRCVQNLESIYRDIWQSWCRIEP